MSDTVTTPKIVPIYDINDAMAEYIYEDKSYEEATQNAIKQLEIYLSE